MKIYNAIPSFQSDRQTIVTIGTFDGVHIGHKEIIGRLVSTAHDNDCDSLILTFFPHPRMVLSTHNDIFLLNTLEEKKALLERTGLDHLVIHPFDEAFSRLEAEAFVKTVLVDQFKVKKIIIGHDHRFGKNRSANIDDLELFGRKYNFAVAQIEAQEVDKVSVSSTKIRKALADGDVALANSYLGYDYFLTGTVVEGKRLGRTIGYPTANLEIDASYKMLPKIGVYAVASIIDNEMVYGMMNIGTNPTVGGTKISVEINYFDLDADLYGLELKVFCLQRLRDEHKFESLQLLKEQLSKDKIAALAHIARQL